MFLTASVGVRAVETTAAAAAKTLGTTPEQIFLASTGVIGEPLPAHKIVDVLDKLKADLAEDRFAEAAKRDHDDGYLPQSRDAHRAPR